jgi:hypothetical protein
MSRYNIGIEWRFTCLECDETVSKTIHHGEGIECAPPTYLECPNPDCAVSWHESHDWQYHIVYEMVDVADFGGGPDD